MIIRMHACTELGGGVSAEHDMYVYRIIRGKIRKKKYINE